MKSIFHRRFHQNLIDNTKILKYVFNDHFIIMFFIILGYLAYLYSQNLSLIIKYNPYLIKSLIAFIFYIEINNFNLVTLLQKPDRNFLLPVIDELKENFKFSTTYSMIFPLLTFVMTTIAVTPILHGFNSQFNLISVLLIIGSLGLMQISRFVFSMLKIYGKIVDQDYIFYIGQGLILSSFVFNQLFLLLGLSIIGLVVLVSLKNRTGSVFKVDDAINWEVKRQNRIQKFYSLFVDLPERSTPLKRRRYLDVFKTKNSTEQNLFLLTFLRSGNYLGIFVRLLLINIVIDFLLKSNLWSLIFSFVFLYLVIFQLIPIYRQISQNFWNQIFPVSFESWIKNFEKLLIKIGLSYTMVNALFILICNPKNWLYCIVFITGGIFFTIIAVKATVTSRLKKGIKR